MKFPFLFSIFFILNFVQKCGTANPSAETAGRCMPLGPSNYVGRADWTIEMPEGGAGDVECLTGSEGVIQVFGVVKNEAGVPTGGISVGTFLSADPSHASLQSADLATDSCGVISAQIKWTCPAEGKSSTLSVFFASGALMGGERTYTLTNATEAGKAAAAAASQGNFTGNTGSGTSE